MDTFPRCFLRGARKFFFFVSNDTEFQWSQTHEIYHFKFETVAYNGPLNVVELLNLLFISCDESSSIFLRYAKANVATIKKMPKTEKQKHTKIHFETTFFFFLINCTNASDTKINIDKFLVEHGCSITLADT